MQITTLDNGLTVITEQKDSDFVTVHYNVSAGSLEDYEKNLGLAHLCEHLVFKGTINRTAKQINYDVEKYGATLNAYTSFQETTFFCTILNEYWEEAFDVLSDLVFNATIPKDEFKSERSVVVEEVKMYKDDGEDNTLTLLRKKLFGDKHKTWYNIGGTVETVSSTEATDVESFIDDYYIPENITLIVAGNVDHDKVVKMITDYIKDYDFKVPAKKHIPVEYDEITIEDVEDSMPGMQSHMMFAMKVPENGLRTLLIEQLITNALGTGLGSRLAILREKYGYCYTIRMDEEQYADGFSLFTGYVGLNKENINSAKELIQEIIYKAAEEGLTTEEFDKAVNNVKCGIKHQFETTADITNFIIMLMSMDLLTEPEEIEKELDSISLDDVNEFMSKYITDNPIMFATMIQEDY